MHVHVRHPVRVVAFAVTLALVAMTAFVAAPASAQVRGFDGTTITVAGIGIASQLGNTEVGAQARIKRFNDDNELKGIKIKWAEMAEDNQDPATTLTEARRLVSQVGVFAIVGDISSTNPGEYFAQQKVPYFGGGFDTTYCSHNPSTQLWGYSQGGCIVPENPSFVSDVYHTMYDYVSKTLNKKTPTFIVVGEDNAPNKNGAKIFSAQAAGAGFKVLPAQTNMPQTPPNDYSPYATAILKADNGNPPDSLFCEALYSHCLGLWDFMKTSGYKGVFEHGIWSDALAKPFEGTIINNPTVNPNETNPNMDKLKADLEAFKTGATKNGVDYGAIVGYTSADMFIQALKTAAAKGKSGITPENVRKAASTIKWEMKGVTGPIQYPKSSVNSFPACFSNYKSDGTKWITAEPYSCSTKTYSPNTKSKG